jgi:peptidoglycan/LPS O-acetylase OafA/YrhL
MLAQIERIFTTYRTGFPQIRKLRAPATLIGQLPGQPRHFAGFDGIRLVGALAVIFSHAFLIATGSEKSEPLVRLLGPHNIVGLYGVFTFFVISGFLLARSLSADPNAIKYMVNRVLRLLPAFIFCAMVCALLIGPVFSSVRLSTYFSDSAVFEYFRVSLDQLTDMKLPGLFAYNGEIANVVNGSLWSLRYEALSYVLLLVLWTVFRRSGLVAGVIVVVAALTRLFPAVERAIAGVAFTLPYFATGVLMNWIYARFGTRKLGALISGAGLLAGCFLGSGFLAFALFGAYLIVFLGERPNFLSKLTNKIGDCSYGLFLYGWPVEQIVKQLTGTTNPWRLMAITLPFAFLLAYISCHVIEEPALGFKRTVADFLKQRARRAASVFHPAGEVAVWGAKLSFVIGAAIIFISENRWPFLFQSMSEVLVGVVVGSCLTVFIYRALVLSGLVYDSIDRNAA